MHKIFMALALLMCASSALAVTDHGEYDGCECISNGEFFCLTQWSSFNLMQIFRLQLGLQETLLRCVKVISVFKLGEFQPSGSRVVPSFRRLPLTLTPGTGGGGGGGGGSGPAWQPTIWRNGHVTVG